MTFSPAASDSACFSGQPSAGAVDPHGRGFGSFSTEEAVLAYDESLLAANYLDARYDKDRRSFPADREYWDSVAVVTKWALGLFPESLPERRALRQLMLRAQPCRIL